MRIDEPKPSGISGDSVYASLGESPVDSSSGVKPSLRFGSIGQEDIQGGISPTLNATTTPFVPRILSDEVLFENVQLYKPKISTSLDDASNVDMVLESWRGISRTKEKVSQYYGSKTLDDLGESRGQEFKSILEAKRKNYCKWSGVENIGAKKDSQLQITIRLPKS